MADPPLLALTGIRFHLGDQTILDGVDLSIAPGERLSLVGRNGAGKSTLLRILAGEPIADGGTRFAQPGVTIATLPQEPDFAGQATVAGYVAGVLADSLGPSDYRVAAILEEMKLDGDRAPGELSGGEARRAALARALVGEPDVMLLDEPTNHLDLPTIEWLEDKLSRWRGAYVMVSHDRRFLATLSRAVLWLDRGIVRRLDRGYGEFEAWSNDILEREATERHKLDRLIERDRMGGQEHPRPAHAQRGSPACARRAAGAAPRADRAGRPRHHRGGPGRELGRAGGHRAQHHQAVG
jgi:ATP-binding cassette subfamily F protein uup